MSLATIQAALVAKAITDTSASVEIDDPLARVLGPGAGITAVSALGYVAGWDRRSDGNVEYAIARIELAMLHRLTSGIDEAAYLEGAMQTDQTLLMDPGWWEVAGVYAVAALPELEADRDRIGRVIRYRVAAQVRFIP